MPVSITMCPTCKYGGDGKCHIQAKHIPHEVEACEYWEGKVHIVENEWSVARLKERCKNQRAELRRLNRQIRAISIGVKSHIHTTGYDTYHAKFEPNKAQNQPAWKYGKTSFPEDEK